MTEKEILFALLRSMDSSKGYGLPDAAYGVVLQLVDYLYGWRGKASVSSVVQISNIDIVETNNPTYYYTISNPEDLISRLL